MDIYKLLESEYEQATENKRLKDFLVISPNEDDFFIIREKISWIIMDTYLFHFNRRAYINDIADEINEKGEDFVKNHLPAFMYELNNSYSISVIYPLLALKGKDWLAHILGREHPLFEDIMNISDMKTGFYLYLKHENDCLYFQHIASDTILPVTIKSRLPLNHSGRYRILMKEKVLWQAVLCSGRTNGGFQECSEPHLMTLISSMRKKNPL